MPNATVKASFQNASYRDRSVGFLLIFAVILIWVALKEKQDARVPDLVGAALFVLLALRNWRAGLFVSTRGVVVRNAWRSRRIPVAQVSRAVFVLAPRNDATWGVIAVETVSGARVNVMSLRRDRDGGEELAGTINKAIDRLRSP